MAADATVDFESLSMILGVVRITGYGSGTVITISYDADQFVKNVGVDGLGFYVKNRNRAATITVVLQQSADANDLLTAIFLADFIAPGGLLVPLMFKENNGRTVYAAEGARIAQLPEATWGDAGETRTWRIITTELEGFVGGLGTTPKAA